MPRTVEFTIPAGKVDGLIPHIREIDGLVGLQVQRGASLHPAGDVVTIQITNQSLHELARLLDSREIGREHGTVVTSEPVSVVSSSLASVIARDTSDATWEEMDAVIARESNMGPNGLLLMFGSGLLATTGIMTNALHIVLAGMLIAPGFEPITRIALGFVSRSEGWKRGIVDTAKAYAMMVAGAALMMLVLLSMDKPSLVGEPTYLGQGELFSYWSQISADSLIISAIGGVMGALLVATKRAVLTGGVMIALALVPAASLAGMSLVVGEWEVFARAAGRWLLEVALVIAGSAAVLFWKQKRVQRRRAAF